MTRYAAPRTVGLAKDEWPKLILAEWNDALTPGAVFSDPGSLSHLKKKTLITVQKAVEKWLFHLQLTGQLQSQTDFRSTYSEANLSSYIAVLRDRLKVTSVCTQLRSLSQAFAALCPNLDRTLLKHAISRLRTHEEPVRGRRAVKTSILELRELGNELMRHWRTCDHTDPRVKAATYRDGFMIAFLCRVPLRLANLTELEIGKHLNLNGDTWILSLPASSMKTSKGLEIELPSDLIGPLSYYLHNVHPILAKNSRDPSALWPGLYNKKLSESGVATAIKNRTQERFEAAVTPHDFRHIIATDLAEMDPTLAGLAASVLQHNSLQTTKSYYIHGKHHQAGRQYGRAIERLISDTEDELQTCDQLEKFLEHHVRDYT